MGDLIPDAGILCGEGGLVELGGWADFESKRDGGREYTWQDGTTILEREGSFVTLRRENEAFLPEILTSL